MKDIIKRALTRRAAIPDGRGNTTELEIPPNQKLVFGIYFAITALAALTALETTYMVVFHNFNNELLAGIMLIVGTILGAFFTQKS